MPCRLEAARRRALDHTFWPQTAVLKPSPEAKHFPADTCPGTTVAAKGLPAMLTPPSVALTQYVAARVAENVATYSPVPRSSTCQRWAHTNVLARLILLTGICLPAVFKLVLNVCTRVLKFTVGAVLLIGVVLTQTPVITLAEESTQMSGVRQWPGPDATR